MMRVGLLLSLAWRNLLRYRRRTLLTLVAIVLAVASMVALGAFMRAWANSTFEQAIENLTGHVQIHAPGYLDDPNVELSMTALGDAMRTRLNQDDVVAWAERVRVPAMVRTERESAPVMLLGIDPPREAGLSFIATAVIEGVYLDDKDARGLLIGKTLMERLQTRLGRRVVLMAQAEDGQIREVGVRIVGVFSAAPEMERGVVFMALQRAQQLLELESRYSEVSIKSSDINNLEDFVNVIRSIEPERHIERWETLQPFTKAMLEMSEGSIYIWILVSFSVVAFGLLNTLLMAVYERMREFGLLQALGMKPYWLLLQVLFEAALLVGVATLIGLLVGAAIVEGFSDGLSLGSWASGATYFGAGTVLYPRHDADELWLIGTVVWGLGIVASLWPAWQAARRIPVDVLNKALN